MKAYFSNQLLELYVDSLSEEINDVMSEKGIEAALQDRETGHGLEKRVVLRCDERQQTNIEVRHYPEEADWVGVQKIDITISTFQHRLLLYDVILKEEYREGKIVIKRADTAEMA